MTAPATARGRWGGEIRERPNAAPGGGGQNAAANPPVHWPTLTVDEAATAWDQLGQWVAETFVPRYEGAEVWVMTWTSHDPLNEGSEPDAGTDSYCLARSRPHADNDPNT